MTSSPNTLAASSTGLRRWLRIEGAAIALAAGVIYAQSGAGWGVFALCFLLPDVAMLGYVAGPRYGALCYNMAHSYTAPLIFFAASGALGQPWALAAASLWVAHIGLDRAIGYGLKYSHAFKATHLDAI
jgi:hypothetical protein